MDPVYLTIISGIHDYKSYLKKEIKREVSMNISSLVWNKIGYLINVEVKSRIVDEIKHHEKRAR